ncbi:MAG: hypothetical protein MJZ67_05180, partial [Bacteroidales bacterium]|nr:hypothetical protein [Bacteroidales bacterium]
SCSESGWLECIIFFALVVIPLACIFSVEVHSLALLLGGILLTLAFILFVRWIRSGWVYIDSIKLDYDSRQVRFACHTRRRTFSESIPFDRFLFHYDYKISAMGSLSFGWMLCHLFEKGRNSDTLSFYNLHDRVLILFGSDWDASEFERLLTALEDFVPINTVDEINKPYYDKVSNRR